MRHISVAASVMALNSASLGEEICALERAGVDLFHWDIMDGHFVPNMTFGPIVVKALRPLTAKEFDVHLMVTEPRKWVEAFADAGANNLTFHAEVTNDIASLADYIRTFGMKAGLALNPSTPLHIIDEDMFRHIDRLLVMTVNPGFGGQAYIDQSHKIETALSLQKRYPHLDIMVDGGINLETAPSVINAGANSLVSGSALAKAGNAATFISSIKGMAA